MRFQSFHTFSSPLAPRWLSGKDAEDDEDHPKKKHKKLSEAQKRKQRRKAKLKAKREKTKVERHGESFEKILKRTVLGRQGRDTLAASDHLRLQVTNARIHAPFTRALHTHAPVPLVPLVRTRTRVRMHTRTHICT